MKYQQQVSKAYYTAILAVIFTVLTIILLATIYLTNTGLFLIFLIFFTSVSAVLASVVGLIKSILAWKSINQSDNAYDVSRTVVALVICLINGLVSFIILIAYSMVMMALNERGELF